MSGVIPNPGYLDATNKTVEQCADLTVKRDGLVIKLADGQPDSTLHAEVTTEPAPPIFFVHQPSNDERYCRREKELKWLDACAKDPAVRIAAVTGQGGLGKTSLVGHWIEKQRGWQQRSFRGVFFYSFYSNRNADSFFEAFLNFVCRVEQGVTVPEEVPLHHLAATACRRWSYLVVLDGLEVLQHDQEDPHYGWIADAKLTEFVARVGADGSSLLVLTSRFPFPRITDENPAAARAMELPLFTKAEGADLLVVCGLHDRRPNLENYSDLLGGHPLALRIFAGACLEKPFDEPETVSREVRSAKGVGTMLDPEAPDLSPTERQKRRQRRQFYKLLRWFQNKLSPPKRRLLQIVAVFRDPVGTNIITRVAHGVDAMKADFAGCDPARITSLLDQLCGQFLLQKEISEADDAINWTAHPIIRDVFREAALSADQSVASQFAEIVAGKGRGNHPRTVAEVLPIVEGIEILLAAGSIRAADELYRNRLDDGYVFLSLPAPQEGLRCSRSFLTPLERRAALERALGQGKLAFYLNEQALYSSILGEMEDVEQTYAEKNAIRFAERSWRNVSIGYQNIADAKALSGKLQEAVACASEALFYAGALQDEVIEGVSEDADPAGLTATILRRPDLAPLYDGVRARDALAYRSNALSLMGRVVAASVDFAAADTFEETPLASVCGLWWARHRIRLGETTVARHLTEANRSICAKEGWEASAARCTLLLGELDILDRQFPSAERRIADALRVFRTANQGYDISDALLAAGQLRQAILLAQTYPSGTPTRMTRAPNILSVDESALSNCEESLRLAARSGFLLKKCDALNFRAQLLRESGEADKALNDAKEAHQIAQRCDFYWGLHESLRQLRDAAKALNRSAEFREWDKAERDLTSETQLKIAAALKTNRRHDAEMERLYGRIRKRKNDTAHQRD